MSILKETDDGFIISHLSYINNIYNNTAAAAAAATTDNVVDNKKTRLYFNNKLFNIISQYLRDNQQQQQQVKVEENNHDPNTLLSSTKKRKRKSRQLSVDSVSFKQIELINKKFTNIMTPDVKKEYFSISDNNNSTAAVYNNNIEARNAADAFYENSSIELELLNKFHGSNMTDSAIVKRINNTDYVFPRNCKFYSYDVRSIGERLPLTNQFDFVLMDPPWWNKFIRRKKTNASYEMMYNREFAEIPVDKLLKPTGLVGIWCTNCQSHLDHIVNVMLPAWGMKVLATWYWIKVTQSGDAVCNFNYKMGKQPFELLIFADKINNTSPIDIPNYRVLISVPSSVHSHKPPLAEVIESFLPTNPNCLELFARYLLPGWTSWGLEVLKFQSMTLYSYREKSTDL